MIALLSIDMSSTDEVSPEDVQRIIAATAIVDVRLDEVHAGPVGRVESEMAVNIDVGEPQIARVDDANRILVRVSHTITCFPVGSEDEKTDFRLSHVVTVDVTSELETTWPAIAAWVGTNIYFLAYPYVRQSVSMLTTSLGLPALVLGYLRRDEQPF